MQARIPGKLSYDDLVDKSDKCGPVVHKAVDSGENNRFLKRTSTVKGGWIQDTLV